MSNVAIHIALEPPEGRPVGLARVNNDEVLRQVARAAVVAARADAKAARVIDGLLGQIGAEEASSHERCFRPLIPGYGEDGTPAAAGSQVV
jgi:hypothetical protein